MSIAAESSNVNHPPELDTVLDHLRRQFDLPDLQLGSPPVRLSGGFWAEMWTLNLTTPVDGGLPAKVVLRLAPDAELARWETILQTSVAEQHYPTPAVHATDFTPTGGDRAWSVMDHADGIPLLGGLSGIRALVSLPRLASGLPDTLARAAADLHRLDPGPVETALTEAANRTIGIEGLLEHYQTRAFELADKPLQRSWQRLAGTRPDTELRVVCHGDLHPFNILAHNGHITVLDWTAGQIAHPAYDLAYTHLLLANPPLNAPRPLRPIIKAAAGRIANRFISTYRSLSPHAIEPATLDWYNDLHGCRILTDLATWHATDEPDTHRGHPWLTIEPTLQRLLTP